MYLSLQKSLLLFAKIEEKLTKSVSRKLVKSLDMPLIYGQTLISINNDMKLAFGPYLEKKDCMLLSQGQNLSFFARNFLRLFIS